MTTLDPDLDPPDPVVADAAVARLVAHHRAFLAFLQSRVGDRALAEDILQDAFIRGIDKTAALRDDESAITASNAGVRVFRAREALRKQVTRACGTCATHGCLDCTCKHPKESP